jgi:hypothetical protein
MTPRGAHLLLQIRTRTLDRALPFLFARWYPRVANDNAITAEPAVAA